MGTNRKPSKAKWAIPAAAVLVLAALAAAWLTTPGVSRPRMGQGELTVRVEEDGTAELSWPAVDAPASSRLTLRSGDEVLLARDCPENTAVVDAALLERPLEITVQGAVRCKNLLGVERELVSRDSIQVSLEPFRAQAPVLTGEGGAPGELALSWDGQGTYELCVLEDGRYRALREAEGGGALLTFGGEGELPLPGYDAPVVLALRAVLRGEGWTLYGPCAARLDVRRELLLGSDLSLECQQLEERVYVLRWNETKGDHYAVQEWNAAEDRWETLAEVPRDGELRYETGLLRSGSDHRYRVSAVDPEEPVEPAELSLRAEISTRYATVWPVVQLACFEDAGLGKALGKIPAGTALCVLEEEGDAFQVRYRDQYVWVDSRFCMINLPEYVGDVCAYDITNSYQSIFMVHDAPIQNITGTVVQGFEHVKTAEDGFLAPYLYPCAKKLLAAAQAAEADGYRLRIYEAFRPNEATRFLYDNTEAQLNYPVPYFDGETGEYVFYEPPEEPEPPVDPEPGLPLDPETGLPAAPEEGGEPALPEDGGDGSPLEEEPVLPEDEGGLQPEEEPESEPEPEPEPEPDPRFPGPTFYQLMTDNGRWRLGSFLAAVTSAHNRGIALDLTIEYLDGRALEMQSAMHDLSWYSAAYLNNENAKLLERYMTMDGVAFRGLSSEWWHFQDDDTREAIGLSAYLTKGVTPEGWTRDNVGWRYRDEEGRYARNTTLKIDGRSYAFDADGYAAE